MLHRNPQLPARKDLDAVESSISLVENSIQNFSSAALPDRYGRVPSEMPLHLRNLYEAGSWKNHYVYLWSKVLRSSIEGHEYAKQAEHRLNLLSHGSSLHFHETPAELFLPVEVSKPINEAMAVYEHYKTRMRGIIKHQLDEANEQNRKFRVRPYPFKPSRYHSPVKQGREQDESLSTQEMYSDDDRLLFAAARASFGLGDDFSVDEIDAALCDIEDAGGTCGGHARWGKSLATIPAQDCSYVPPLVGYVMADPLLDYDMAKLVNPWTKMERLIFLEKYIVHQKNFRRIATFFQHKSLPNVIHFYYKVKLPFKLKHLVKDVQVKKRPAKKHSLRHLAYLPDESRSMATNFAWEWESPYARPSVNDGLYPSMPADEFSVNSIASNWNDQERKALAKALDYHRSKVDTVASTDALPVVWCHIALQVKSKTPLQCKQFYDLFMRPPVPTVHSSMDSTLCSPIHNRVRDVENCKGMKSVELDEDNEEVISTRACKPSTQKDVADVSPGEMSPLLPQMVLPCTDNDPSIAVVSNSRHHRITEPESDVCVSSSRSSSLCVLPRPGTSGLRNVQNVVGSPRRADKESNTASPAFSVSPFANPEANSRRTGRNILGAHIEFPGREGHPSSNSIAPDSKV